MQGSKATDTKGGTECRRPRKEKRNIRDREEKT